MQEEMKQRHLRTISSNLRFSSNGGGESTNRAQKPKKRRNPSEIHVKSFTKRHTALAISRISSLGQNQKVKNIKIIMIIITKRHESSWESETKKEGGIREEDKCDK
uniref:Uncharacterized protein n=1 Tax=Cucumis melo TaxID=3656 RepID=A0A9I9DKI7_CUCME